MGGRTDFASGTLEDKKKGALNIANAVKKYAETSPIPVALHLDHGKNLDSCIAAIAGGYTSVMIDGSSLPFDENVELTREVYYISAERQFHCGFLPCPQPRHFHLMPMYCLIEF